MSSDPQVLCPSLLDWDMWKLRFGTLEGIQDSRP